MRLLVLCSCKRARKHLERRLERPLRLHDISLTPPLPATPPSSLTLPSDATLSTCCHHHVTQHSPPSAHTYRSQRSSDSEVTSLLLDDDRTIGQVRRVWQAQLSLELSEEVEDGRARCSRCKGRGRGRGVRGWVGKACAGSWCAYVRGFFTHEERLRS